MAETSDVITVALAGNPNSGKTTIFNALTGTRQKVGNYPGVTVEIKEGSCRRMEKMFRIVDLPGTYSLTAYSEEERIARDFILNEHPDVVIDVVDASNPERNLYLATQLIEMKVPLILAFNMSDLAQRRGMQLDIPKLSALLGAPIVELVGNKGTGIDELMKAVTEEADTQALSTVQINYGTEIEEEIHKMCEQMTDLHESTLSCGPRWLAVKLLEQDQEVVSQVQDAKLLEAADHSIHHLRGIFGEEPDMVLADRRYGFISGACQEAVLRSVEARHEFSDQVDTVITHSFFGVIIFGVLMYITFWLTFTLGEYPMAWLEHTFAWIGQVITNLWPEGVLGPARSLLVDGIIAGVGGVLVFLPNILLLFLAIAFLEDTGYMARGAFVMDRFMHKIGLHGKSFIPMVIGFGCSIPAILSTRILENRRSRLTTMMVIPLMSCGARLPIYGLMIPAFFPPQWRGPALWIIYVIGIILAAIMAKILRMTVFRGETTPFVMELPPYRFPTGKGLLIHMWTRAKDYLKKAGTIILAASIILWAATNFPKTSESELEKLEPAVAQQVSMQRTVAGRVGTAMEPVLKPLGFDWRIGTALVGAVAAKEVFVSQMSILYAVGESTEATENLRSHLQNDYSPLQGFCIMLFCLISMPCVATLAVTRKESGSWKWAFLQVSMLTGLAYVVTLCVYQLGSLFI